ncbi:hypothetical protein PU630_07750 [Microbacterium horticulturae]|uniref:Terminase small subunit n=1 Tax=Microbacterium horticulturae TaxID=3028316 RepID=A0ABY8C5E4_9MICO|nr:hypothetical protein [Microbacterium sp. KACC 23027]WEG10425.1 hypothetical protein PU630_07750 [Microbacterium sp. KACC 23027]
MAAPRPPAGLSTKSAKFWRETLKLFELDPPELQILEYACREFDLIQRMDAALVDLPLVVPGSNGQDVSHPLLAEVRQHRVTFSQLLNRLALPDAVTADMKSAARSQHAQRAAAERWQLNK